jgi:hypothetical protein
MRAAQFNLFLPQNQFLPGNCRFQAPATLKTMDLPIQVTCQP